MTNIKLLNRPRRGGRKCRTARPSSVMHSLSICFAIIVGLTGCTEETERKPVAESWERIDQEGRVVDIGEESRHHCVFDRRTDLLWEVKQRESGAHRFDATYSWYSNESAQHMSEPGRRDGGDCDLERCDTEALVSAINDGGLCGHHDWRLPQREELLTLGDYRLIETGNVLDPAFFPHALPDEYWSASTFRLYPPSAWVVSAANGLDRGERKREARLARLVRGEIFNPRKPLETN